MSGHQGVLPGAACSRCAGVMGDADYEEEPTQHLGEARRAMNQSVPLMVPVLSRGKHRRPKDGACFMEMASFLGGQRWTDRPPGTHPLLAHLARLVNDFTSDARRPLLNPFVPSVIGLDSTDPRWDDALALLTATVALPLAPAWNQPALAAGLLFLQARLVDDQDPHITSLRTTSGAALASTPDAAAWAQGFADRLGPARTRVGAGGQIVQYAVGSIAAGGRPQADDDLRELLAAAIKLCQRLAGHAPPLSTPGMTRSTAPTDHDLRVPATTARLTLMERVSSTPEPLSPTRVTVRQS